MYDYFPVCAEVLQPTSPWASDDFESDAQMIDDLDWLYLQGPVGKGQENNPKDVEALDDRLRKVNAYVPPAEYAESAQHYATEPMIGALERYQERRGLKIDGVAKPGGPTERAINNDLLQKPRGAGLLYDPPSALTDTVGNGFENRREDVATVKRGLGALGLLPEDPFDKPHGFIDEATTNGIKAFQRAKGLTDDGWLAPNGETERALQEAVADLTRVRGGEWLRFADRAASLERAIAMKAAYFPAGTSSPQDDEDGGKDEGITLAKVLPRPMPTPGNPGRSIPGPRPLEPRGLIEIDPRAVPPPRLRWSEPMPRDQEFRNPGERPSGPPLHLPRFDRLPKPDEPLGINDVPRALGRRPDSSLDADVRRALPFVPVKPEPKQYIPEPGSPLRIPVLDIHHGGIRGDERSVQTTKDTTKALIEACDKVFQGSATFERKLEQYYPFRPPEKGQRKGSSFADEWMGMSVNVGGVLTIDFVTDSFTPKVDGSPNAAEESRYLKLQHNRRGDEHVVTVRVPKAWTLGQTLNKKKLKEAAKEICEQIKKLIDSGEIAPGKGRLAIERTLKELVEPRKKRAPDPEELPEADK